MTVLQKLIRDLNNLAKEVGDLIQLRGFKPGGTAGQVPVKGQGDFQWNWGSLKTINSQSILGTGNLSVALDLTSGPVRSSGGVSTIADGALTVAMISGLRTELNTLVPDSTLQYYINGLQGDIALKQASLVSGENIKTINSSSILGTGNLTIAEANATNIASSINGVAGKTTPADADVIPITDSAASSALKKLTFANLWTWVKGKIETAAGVLIPVANGGTGATTVAAAKQVFGLWSSTRTQDSAARTNSTYADDSGTSALTLPQLTANKVYRVEFCLRFSCGAGGIKAQVANIQTYAAIGTTIGVSLISTGTPAGISMNTNFAVLGTRTTSTTGTTMQGHFYIAASSTHTPTLQWAQNSTDVSETKLLTSSTVAVIEL